MFSYLLDNFIVHLQINKLFFNYLVSLTVKLMNKLLLFFYQQKYNSIIYNMKISTSGTVIYTTQHSTLQSYGDLILAIHQELGDHRFDRKLGTQTQKGYMLIPP